MPRNGSGTYALPSGQPVVTNTTISSTTFNTLTADLANALTTSVATDGQTAMTANLPMGGHKLTGLAAATGAGESLRYEQLFPINATGIAGLSSVRGLVGAVNAATPLTKYDLQALAVTLRDTNGALASQINTATITCDLGLIGPAANGRDQAAVFAINTWIYLYFIWNGTTLATLASTTAPASFTGSTLPAGYTHWAFATALRWNGSSNIIPMRTQGSSTWYDLSDGGVNRVLASGAATTMTAIACAGFIPPNALRGIFSFLLSGASASVTTLTAKVRPTGAATTGVRAASALVAVAGGPGEAQNTFELPLGTSTQIDYLLTVAPSSGGLFVDVVGFVIPNGDS